MVKLQKIFLIIGFVLLTGLTACNLMPGNDSVDALEAVQSFAYETVVAELTTAADQAEENHEIELAEAETPTPEPTDPQPTVTTEPCNQVSFVADVTIPDQTNIMVGEAFTKTWRLRNTGSCTWTSGYQLMFNSGDSMNGVMAQQLTPGTVPPDGTLDVSVDLVAPGAPGTYKGFWELQEPGGSTYAPSSGAFWVEIVAVELASTPMVLIPIPIVQTMTANLVAEESGSVRSNGQVLSPRNVGDHSANIGSQAFLSFDISAIPAGATITSVEVDFTKYDTLGDPFSLGCLRLYKQDYGTF